MDKLDMLLNDLGEWLRAKGPNANIVISSRIRLARNLKKIPFYHWANGEHRKKIYDKIKKTISEIDFLKKGLWLDISELNEIDKIFLIERHLMSRELAEKGPYKALFIGDKEILSIMINEEDHIRLQVLQSGFALNDALNIAHEIDSQLASKLSYAFSYEFGYLTACPTNAGNGLRASVMLHLPMLVISKQINNVVQTISKLSLTTRGFYGEGTEAKGNFFQVSNQVTLGQSELETTENLIKVVSQIINYEQNARERLISQNKHGIEDQVWRSYGLLKNARVIDSNEAIDLLSNLRLGIDLGMVDIDLRDINELMLLIQPAHLQKFEKKKLNTRERDIKRAELIRERLK
jgi:protein arginine kinase